ncbi:MAG TPA: 50S ribosomal protein L17 [Chloroflexota bacterium]|nr:50S ribosomal protein L17 [Chloroflexota bacterium]
MRHLKSGRRLGVPGDRRRALLRGLMSALLRHEHIKTTEARAKELRPRIERLITLAKRGDLHARRLALSYLPDPVMIEKLFTEVAPRYQDRAGGYTRILKIGMRKGDAAEIVQIELV